MNPTASPRPDGSRRRLLRGALSAPAVMTVCTGSAFAASSSMQCVQNQMANPEFPGVSTEQDLWRRVQLSAHLPDGADPGAFVYYYNDQGVWKRFDVVNNVLTDEVLDGVPNEPAGAPQSWAVIRYDDQGLAVGVGKGSDGSALTGTCWSSFVAVNP